MLAASQVRAEESVTLSGFVTRASSQSDFNVNAIRIRCDDRTRTYEGHKNGATKGCPQDGVYVGRAIKVHGVFHAKDRSISAERIELADPSSQTIKGTALIDALPDPVSKADSLLIRADGYKILITGKTLIAWDPQIGSLSQIRPGDWIAYRGHLRADGIVVADRVHPSTERVSESESKFREKSDYDPAKVPAAAEQNGFHRAFIGIDYKRIPPYPDAAMQARVAAIGEKLIPEFQRKLPSGDPAKIEFRFQVTDDARMREVAPLPSGVILIPHEAVERMQNDSQLAALLADSVALTLERGPYRTRKAVIGTTVASYLVLNPAIAFGLSAAARHAALSTEEQQSGRVSIGLLHDAGYDIDQAPVAWWLLASKEPRPISEIPLPQRAANLYQIIGEEWHNPAVQMLRSAKMASANESFGAQATAAQPR